MVRGYASISELTEEDLKAIPPQSTGTDVLDAALCSLGVFNRTPQSEQEAIIHQAGVVDAVGVDDHSAYEPAELDQVMPIASVAGESGGFDAKYRANVACTDIGHQLLEAWAINLAPTRTAEIAIDRAHIMKTQFSCAVRQVVLAALALEIVDHLSWRRLAHIDNGSTPKPFRSQLRIRHRSPPRRPRLAEAWPAQLPARVDGPLASRQVECRPATEGSIASLWVRVIGSHCSPG
jgi:hypothetical protein